MRGSIHKGIRRRRNYKHNPSQLRQWDGGEGVIAPQGRGLGVQNFPTVSHG